MSQVKVQRPAWQSVIREVDWLSGDGRFSGKLRLPSAAYLVKFQAGGE